MIKKAYMQGEAEGEGGEESEDEEGGEGGEDGASPRNVGHNIYILAHQVGPGTPAVPAGPARVPPDGFSPL